MLFCDINLWRRHGYLDKDKDYAGCVLVIAIDLIYNRHFTM